MWLRAQAPSSGRQGRGEERSRSEGLVDILSGVTGEERVVLGGTSGLSEAMRVSEQEMGGGGKPE
jgi:hypothetical protein